MKGLDLSFSATSRAWWADRRAEGFRVMSQCLWTGGVIPQVAHENLSNAKAERFIITGYTNTKLAGGDVAIAKAKEAARDLWGSLYQVQVDVEIPGVREVDIYNAVVPLEGMGKRPCIYSANWFWKGVLGNPTWPWLKSYPLWNAYYDDDPDYDFWRAPYGPWDMGDLIGEQYTGTTRLAGVDVDLNEFKDSFFEEDVMTLAFIRITGQAAIWATNWMGKWHVPNTATLKELAKAAGVPVNASGAPAIIDTTASVVNSIPTVPRYRKPSFHEELTLEGGRIRKWAEEGARDVVDPHDAKIVRGLQVGFQATIDEIKKGEQADAQAVADELARRLEE